MILKSKSDSITHIHIPRTGGRYVVELLLSNGYELHGDYHFTEVIDGVEVIHFHADLIEKYFSKFKDRSFSIIRDPVDRFKSAFPLLLEYSKTIGMEKVIFSSEVDKILKSSQELICNWFRPQSEFILPNTHVWNYGNGLSSKFIDWLNDDVGLFVKQTDVDFTKNLMDSKESYPFTKEMISSVENFYKSDYKLISKYN
jgi:hypothetical protein